MWLELSETRRKHGGKVTGQSEGRLEHGGGLVGYAQAQVFLPSVKGSDGGLGAQGVQRSPLVSGKTIVKEGKAKGKLAAGWKSARH